MAGGRGPAAAGPAAGPGGTPRRHRRAGGHVPQYLSELERGRKDPSSEILAAVAGALGVGLLEVVRLAHADLAQGARPRGPVLLAA